MTARTDDTPAIAVFVGPSLPRAAAASILDTDYLPPAQFGDVYRLIGSGVRSIVLLDGVFHGKAPVWQRELLAAMRAGIRVYGGASMGALRAAELSAHGMIGFGAVYQWYMTGEIDGDDEVALLHAGPEQGYQPLSEPLVNVRATLDAATSRGLIERVLAAAIVAHLKALPFWARTADTRLAAPAFTALGAPERARLRAFFAEEPVDLKRRDAELTLTEVARRLHDPPPSALPSPSIASSYDRLRLLRRGFFRGEGRARLEGAQLVEWLLSVPSRRRQLRWALSARFFATQWALDTGVMAPQPQPQPQPDWLRANTLSVAEHTAIAERQQLASWLLAQAPEAFGYTSMFSDEDLQSSALRTVWPEPEIEIAPEVLRDVCSRHAFLRALPWIAAWCERAGAVPPSNEATPTHWRNASNLLAARGRSTASERFLCAMWAIERGPVYFGYATWSFAAELLAVLQCTGEAGTLAARVPESSA